MKKFKAVVFDMDGLLLDSERLSYKAFQETCQQYKLGHQAELYRKTIGSNADAMKAILSEGLGFDVSRHPFWKDFRATYHHAIETAGIPVKTGALELLEHIDSLQIPAVVATSTDTELASKKLANTGILHRFKFITGADQVNRSKPEPDIYLQAVNNLQLDVTDCLALEDSENGVRSALAAGLTVIQIPDLVYPSDQFKQIGHIILDSLLEVIHYNFDTTSSS